MNDLNAVIYVCPLCSMLHATHQSFEVDHPFSGQSVLWDQMAIAYPSFLNPTKLLSCTGQILSLTASPLCYWFPGILSLEANDLVLTKQVGYSNSLAL